MQKTARNRLTYQDLCEMFPEVDNVRRELIDGELFVTPAPTKRHQRAVVRILVGLHAFAQENGGDAYGSPVDTMFSDESVVHPDVMYISADNVDSSEVQLVRKVDLVVEVSSPSTRRIDLGRKRDLYERYAVPEYWFVDLDADRIEVYRLEGGRYGESSLFLSGERLSSPLLPGFEIEVDEVLGPRSENAES
jgi:Uma2 family endonuclease